MVISVSAIQLCFSLSGWLRSNSLLLLCPSNQVFSLDPPVCQDIPTFKPLATSFSTTHFFFTVPHVHVPVSFQVICLPSFLFICTGSFDPFFFCWFTRFPWSPFPSLSSALIYTYSPAPLKYSFSPERILLFFSLWVMPSFVLSIKNFSDWSPCNLRSVNLLVFRFLIVVSCVSKSHPSLLYLIIRAYLRI